MKPLKLTMTAFGPFVTKQNIDFSTLDGEEIFLVTGETGAGKTTIFDAMSFALYGSASGDSRKPNTFKSDHAAPSDSCHVEFDFSLRGKTYYIRRSPAQRGIKRDGSPKDIPPSAELSLPDGGLVTGANAVTERIEQLLGLNHRQFKQTTMLAQGEFRQLIEATGKEKQQIFSKIFGTSIYSDLTDRLTRAETELQRATQSSREAIARCIRELGGYGYTALMEDGAEFLPYERIAEIVNEAVSLLEAKSVQLDEDIARIEAEKAKLDPERAKTLNEKLERRDKLRATAAELEAKKAAIKTTEKQLEQLNTAVELAGREEIIMASKSQYEELDRQITELERKLETLGQKEQILLASQDESAPELLALKNDLSERESRFDAVYRAFLDGQAALLAQGLTDGNTCPVCGSTHHPSPAAPSVAPPSEKRVNDAKSAVTEAAKRLEAKREALKNEYWLAKSERDKCEERLESVKAHRASVDAQFSAQRAAFIEKLQDSGFAGYKDYRAALDGKAEIPQRKRQIEDYNKNCTEVSAQLFELERDTQNRIREDVDAVIQAGEALTRELAALRESKTELYAVLTGSKKQLAALKALYGRGAESDRKYAIARELATLARGSRTVSFERYILASYFDDIIKVSNIHLQQMTGARYRLRRPDDSGRGAGSGLDMEIIDSYTGKPRDIATLSGGESFKASLALALGLSEVVQIYAGGVSIEAMFIDEGFGSLDEKSLDSAVKTLISLKQNGRMVGVISHVQSLRGYIPKKLAVCHGATGSTVSWM